MALRPRGGQFDRGSDWNEYRLVTRIGLLNGVTQGVSMRRIVRVSEKYDEEEVKSRLNNIEGIEVCRFMFRDSSLKHRYVVIMGDPQQLADLLYHDEFTDMSPQQSAIL